jgi:hypothetical protein
MGIVINFPGNAERSEREFEAMLEKQLDGMEPELKHCIKKKVASVLAKNSQIPSLSMKVSLPMGVTEESIQPLVEAFRSEYTEKVTEFARNFVAQICVLEAKICKLETSLRREQ